MALKQKLKAFRQESTNTLLTFICWLIVHLLPSTRWYPVSLAICRLLTRSAARFSSKSNQASLTPRLLHRFLDLLSVYNVYFPIPIRVEGEDLLRRYAAQPGGFVCCSAHLPFIKLFFPIARKIMGDQRPRSIIAREPVGDNEVTVWNDVPWKAIRTDHATLLHSRSLLRQNGCLVVIVDKEEGEFISSNIFRFAGKMNSPILMWFSQLQADGQILLRILLPPGPTCKTEQEIHANLDFVAQNVHLILQGETIAFAGRVEAVPAYADTEDRSREIHRIQLYSNLQLEMRMRRLQVLLAERNGSLTKRDVLEERLALMKSEMEIRTGTEEYIA